MTEREARTTPIVETLLRAPGGADNVARLDPLQGFRWNREIQERSSPALRRWTPPATCPHLAVATLEALAADDLDSEDRRLALPALVDHLADCDDCGEWIEQLREDRLDGGTGRLDLSSIPSVLALGRPSRANLAPSASASRARVAWASVTPTIISIVVDLEFMRSRIDARLRSGFGLDGAMSGGRVSIIAMQPEGEAVELILEASGARSESALEGEPKSATWIVSLQVCRAESEQPPWRALLPPDDEPRALNPALVTAPGARASFDISSKMPRSERRAVEEWVTGNVRVVSPGGELRLSKPAGGRQMVGGLPSGDVLGRTGRRLGGWSVLEGELVLDMGDDEPLVLLPSE